MGFEKIELHGHDSTKWNSEVIPMGRADCVLVPDAHGSWLKIVEACVRHGLIKFADGVDPEKAYQNLVKLHAESAELSTRYWETKKTLRRRGLKLDERTLANQKMNSLAGQFKDNFLSFQEALSQLEVLNEGASLLLIGDEVADRNGSDGNTLYFFKWLSEKKIKRNSLISNHGQEFIRQFFCNGSPGDGNEMVSFGDAASACGLHAWREFEVIPEVDIQAMLHEYASSLKVLGYSLSEDNKSISLFSHAPIRLDIIAMLAAKFGVAYQDNTAIALAQTIANINCAFQMEYLILGMGGIYQKYMHNTGVDPHDPRYIANVEKMSPEDRANFPLVYCMWNRWDAAQDADQTARPSEYKGYQVNHYFHGHDGHPFKDNLDTFRDKWNNDSPRYKAILKAREDAQARYQQLITSGEVDEAKLAEARAELNSKEAWVRSLTEYKVAVGKKIEVAPTLDQKASSQAYQLDADNAAYICARFSSNLTAEQQSQFSRDENSVKNTFLDALKLCLTDRTILNQAIPDAGIVSDAEGKKILPKDINEMLDIMGFSRQEKNALSNEEKVEFYAAIHYATKWVVTATENLVDTFNNNPGSKNILVSAFQKVRLPAGQKQNIQDIKQTPEYQRRQYNDLRISLETQARINKSSEFSKDIAKVLTQVKAIGGVDGTKAKKYDDLCLLNRALNCSMNALTEEVGSKKHTDALNEMLQLSRNFQKGPSRWRKLGIALLILAALILVTALVLAFVPTGGTSVMLGAVAGYFGLSLLKTALAFAGVGAALTATGFGFTFFKGRKERNLGAALEKLHQDKPAKVVTPPPGGADGAEAATNASTIDDGEPGPLPPIT